jgi:hypothetical protein
MPGGSAAFFGGNRFLTRRDRKDETPKSIPHSMAFFWDALAGVGPPRLQADDAQPVGEAGCWDSEGVASRFEWAVSETRSFGMKAPSAAMATTRTKAQRHSCDTTRGYRCLPP